MIGVVARTVSAGGSETFALGPLFSGVVLRGVWLTVGNGIGSQWTISLLMSAEWLASGMDVSSGESLVESSEDVALGTVLPMLRIYQGVGSYGQYRVPCFVPIREGPRWVMVVARCVQIGHIWAGLEFEPERVVRPSIDRGPAARRGVESSAVLAELRAEALAAVG